MKQIKRIDSKEKKKVKKIMRNYLKRRGINLRKAKTWTLKSEGDLNDIIVSSWYGGFKKNQLFYSVGIQDKIQVQYRGQIGTETPIAYKDRKQNFVVDSFRQEYKLAVFTDQWVRYLTKEKYEGSWTLKKELRKDKLKTLDKLNKSLEKQYQDSVKSQNEYNSGKHRSVKNLRKDILGNTYEYYSYWGNYK